MTEVLEHSGFKFELMPNGAQRRLMSKTAGCCRFVYNKALAEQKEKYVLDEKKFSYAEQNKHLTTWKKEKETFWLKEVPSQSPQQALKDLDRAFTNFFEKRGNFPRFKKKGQGDSFRIPQGFKLDEANSRVFLPKLGWMRYRKSREIDGKPKNITVSLAAGKWYMSICAQRPFAVQKQADLGPIGIDMGIVNFAAISDGTVIEPLNAFKKNKKKLKKAEKAKARKKKGSRNWHKAKKRVAKIHNSTANARNDFLHKASTSISKTHAVVVVEDLLVKNMSASASGTLEEPGKNIRQKSGLNRSILDQGWGMFRVQLEYKLKRRGGELIKVPPHHTSQKCPICGHTHKDNRKTQADFKCLECGYENNADLVGALNVLAAGLAVSSHACGGIGAQGQPVKQEPTEETWRGLSLQAR